jgi:hypothetical protein
VDRAERTWCPEDRGAAARWLWIRARRAAGSFGGMIQSWVHKDTAFRNQEELCVRMGEAAARWSIVSEARLKRFSGECLRRQKL